MEHQHFMCAVGLGMLAGAAVGIMVSPGRKELKKATGQAAQMVEKKAECISQAMKS